MDSLSVPDNAPAPKPRARFALGAPRLGFRPVYLVDEAGALVHTDPVCTISDREHVWFFPWLEAQADALPDLVHGWAALQTEPTEARQ